MDNFFTNEELFDKPLTQEELFDKLSLSLDTCTDFEENLRKSILEIGDAVGLDMYVKLKSATDYTLYDNYARIFGLCRLLGAINLYDIGCGDCSQAFLLLRHQDISYTGIDCSDVIDFGYANDLFAKFCGERIKFQKAEYPFDIMPEKNNAAISCFCLGTLIREKQEIKNTATALSRNFERILLNIYDKNYEVWENALADFTLQKIGNKGFVFGTKFSKDIAKLKSIGYNCFNNEFSLSVAGNSNAIITKNRLF